MATTSFNPKRRIPVIGIVGGIGSGKSAVTEWVAERANVAIINADELGHQALTAPTVKADLCARFGMSILGTDGAIERAALARQVFGPESDRQAARHELERIVHPEIGRRIIAAIESAAAADCEAVLLDAAVLLEAGWRSQCDYVVFIDTPDAVRQTRVLEGRGWTADELQRRELSQWSLMEKRRESDLIVNNDSDLESTGQQLLGALRQRGLINQG